MPQKKDNPGAAVISPEDDEQLKQQQMDRFWHAVESIGARNADKDPDEVLRFVTEVVEEVRQEHYEREQCSVRSSTVRSP